MYGNVKDAFKLLKDVEWKGVVNSCPSCVQLNFHGHSKDCELKTSLKTQNTLELKFTSPELKRARWTHNVEGEALRLQLEIMDVDGSTVTIWIQKQMLPVLLATLKQAVEVS